MRYLTKCIKQELKEKMIILCGPRQTGKTWLAKELCQSKGLYLNWDIRKDQKLIRELSWPKDIDLLVLDELHKYKNWKNYLKGVVDEFKNTPPVLVTGSARLDAFRRAGDALTGRYYLYRLHPIDIAEAALFMPKTSSEKKLDHLMATGGFPEAFLNPRKANKIRNDRFDLVIQEDLRDLSKTNAIRDIELLIELLRERVGSNLNYTNLAQDLKVSPNTIRGWIDLLEKLYIIFLVPPYSKGLARSLRKEPKIYFYDCAAAYSEDQGPVLENSAACALLKYCHYQRDVFGTPMGLYYFRDREKREVDFVITQNRKVKWAIEIKASDDTLSPSLRYFRERIQPQASLQLVRNLKQEKQQQGIKITGLADWFNRLGNVSHRD